MATPSPTTSGVSSSIPTSTPAFDPDQILSHLISQASSLHSAYGALWSSADSAFPWFPTTSFETSSTTPSTTLGSTPAPTPIIPVITPAPSSDSNIFSAQMAEGERIYSALESWASEMKSLGYQENFAGVQSQLAASQALTSNSPTSLASSGIKYLVNSVDDAALNGTGLGVVDAVGYMTHQFGNLSVAFLAIVTIFLFVSSIFLALFGAKSIYILSSLGKERGRSTSRAYIQGGVGGVVGGALVGGIVGALAVSGAVKGDSKRDGASPKDAVQAVPLIAIMVACAVVFGAAAGRWRPVAKASLAALGGLFITVLLTLTIHIPALLPRLILLAVVLVFAMFFVMVPDLVPSFPLPISTSSKALIVFTSAIGGTALALGIDIWAKKGWIDAVGLLISTVGVFSVETPAPGDDQFTVSWNSANFKGMLAGAWMFMIFGCAWQFWRFEEVGEDPDEQWNKYLGSYVDNEKSFLRDDDATDRAGTFEPPLTFWQRVRQFSRKGGSPAATYGGRNALTSIPAHSQRHRISSRGSLVEFDPEKGFKRPARYDGTFGRYDIEEEEDSGTIVGSYRVGEKEHHRKVDGVKFLDEATPSRPASWSQASGATRPRLKTMDSQASGFSRTSQLTGTTAVGSPTKLGRMSAKYDAEESDDDDDDADSQLRESRTGHRMSIPEPKKKGFMATMSNMFSGGSKKNRRAAMHPDPEGPVGRRTERSINMTNQLPIVSRDYPEHSPLATPTPPPPADLQTRTASIDGPHPAESTIITRTRQSQEASRPSKPEDASAPPPEGFAAVPATPSLINALERIAQAQKQAREFRAKQAEAGAIKEEGTEEAEREHENKAEQGSTGDRPGNPRRDSQIWDGWWKEVDDKAEAGLMR